jgi:glycosyltransferase involved in cell wall biosynthesis
MVNNPADAVFDYEMAFGPILEELRPNLIHAHDFHMIGVAMTAARNLRRTGHDTKVVYDAHELLEGLPYEPRLLHDWLTEEEAHIRDVDAVVCVSPVQAARLKERYRLAELPTVTLNAPVIDESSQPPTTIRDDLGIDGKILVYHGTANRERGVFLLVESLALLEEDVHVAFVLQRDHALVPDLKDLAKTLGVSHRVHILEFVPSAHVPSYLSTADLAVIPLLRTGNHDKTLPNKLFEALQAGLPVLSSDMEASGGFLHEHEVGNTFESGSAVRLAEVATEMLADIDAYRSKITTEVRALTRWDSQAAKLARLYGRLLGQDERPPVHIAARDVEEVEGRAPRRSDQKRVAIGPRNMAGQAYMIAAAIQANLGIPALSFAIEREGILRHPIHQRIPRERWRDSNWQLRQRADLASGFSHVLTESGTGPLGSLNGGFIDEQLPMLRDDGLEVGLILHGSELRDPRRHVHRPYSPYAVNDDLTHRMEQATARLRAHLEGLEIPTFVTTPDLLEDIDAEWLPVVVDYQRWSSMVEPFSNPVPTILHLPSRGRLKGSEYIDQILHRLSTDGRIRYLRPEDHVDPSAVFGLVEQADIVIDGIVIGAYGVMSCQTLAAGRISIANLSELGFLRAECPIVDANPGTLEAVLEELVAHRDSWKEISIAGREFALKYHSGAFTSEVLKPFLGIG